MVQWNPFLDTGTATAYADSRPDHHSSAVAAAVRLFSLCTPIPLVVDVGCGTGMSSRAFAAAATTVLGVDPSRPMLTAGAPHTRVQASAERLPIRDGVVDLVTAAAAFHWFDQPVALREIVRALRPGGAVAVYTDFFSGRLRGADDATAWLADVYRPHFPAPARGPFFARETAEAAGLRFVGEQQWERDVPMTPERLTRDLMSQSNATSAMDDGRITVPELRNWLHRELSDRMRCADAHFTGRLWACRSAGL